MKRIRLRYFSLFVLLALAIAACGGGKDIADPTTTSAGGGDETSSTSAGETDPCAGATLEASDTGITDSEITITVMADTGSPLAPGLFQGAIDAVEGWAKWKNSVGGLACRKIVVKKWDSLLNPDEAKNGITNACDTSFAMVGTAALFMNDVKPLENCTGPNGKGMPDFAVLQTEPVQQCSQFSWAVLGQQGACPYSGTGERKYLAGSEIFKWYQENIAPDLHGVWVVPADLPSTITSSMPGFRISQDFDGDGPGTDGIKLDAEFGASGRAEQSAYTPIVTAITDNKSNYVRNGLDYAGTVKMLKEAKIQGVEGIEVWDCSLQCYDQKLIDEAGDAAEGLYAWMTFTPFEEAGSNAVLDAFLATVPTDKQDGFGAQAWASGELFAQSVNDAIAASGSPNITRADALEAVKNIHDFTAGGFMAPTDVGAKQTSACFVLVQVEGGKFVRVEPAEPGTFNCDGEAATLTIDAAKEFKG